MPANDPEHTSIDDLDPEVIKTLIEIRKRIIWIERMRQLKPIVVVFVIISLILLGYLLHP